MSSADGHGGSGVWTLMRREEKRVGESKWMCEYVCLFVSL